MKEARTSDSHPINLDFIKGVWPGQLAMTFAPGKVQRNAMTGTWDRCLDKDLGRIKNQFKIDVLVCLLEEEQMAELKIPHLLSECQKLGITTQWFQVIDNTVPKDKQKYKSLVKKVVQEYLKKGKNVVVHCKGGLGRAGTFAAACLIYSQLKPIDAIKLVQSTRKNTINNLNQQEWLLNGLKQ